ncbi:ParA family protein [Cystobacter fuscus]|uniref:ParA family protein n=1 Tax=Cystobacter fuscus TaxID=43 RepID=UPI002B2BDDC2|nr:ParA family protein [Cystobacter fuscus]
MKSLVLVNNKGGVGKTTLTLHIAHVMARMGRRVVALDCDPQCNLSAILLGEDELFDIWEQEAQDRTVSDCVEPVRRGEGKVRKPHLTRVDTNLWLLPGKLELSGYEQLLAEEWVKKAVENNERALDVTTSLDVLSNLAAQAVNADVVLFDIGPNLGALTRATLLACDAVIVPVAPDLFSLQGLRNIGPALRAWREEWHLVRERHMEARPQADHPPHEFRPIGYIVQQHLARADRPVSGYATWSAAIPAVFHQEVLQDKAQVPASVDSDPFCIASVKHFSSLVPIAQQARKPLFDLKKADGIGGGQVQAVALARKQFEKLTVDVLSRLDALPP